MEHSQADVAWGDVCNGPTEKGFELVFIEDWPVKVDTVRNASGHHQVAQVSLHTPRPNERQAR